MSDTDKDKKDNILQFSDLEKRRKQSRKEDKKAQKEQEKLEDEYRRQYRIERSNRARMQSDMARRSASGKQPFINWERIPPFTRTIVAIFIIVHLAVMFLLDDAQRFALYMNFGFIPAYYTGAIPWSWSAAIAPLTTAFLHGGWMHIVTNCIMATAMGVFFERQFGARITLIFFIFCTLCGDLTYFILSPHSTNPVIGASGGISGIFGAVIMMMNISGMTGLKAQKRGPFPVILVWIAIMIGVGLISSETAWQAHLGGFLGGIALFQLWRKGKIRF